MKDVILAKQEQYEEDKEILIEHFKFSYDRYMQAKVDCNGDEMSFNEGRFTILQHILTTYYDWSLEELKKIKNEINENY